MESTWATWSNRVRLLKWVVAPLALVTLAGYGLYHCIFCSDAQRASAVAKIPGSGREGEIVVRLPSYPAQSLEPYVWAPQTVLMQGTLFEGLFGYDRDLNVVPKIADSWVLSLDKLTWTIALRRDKQWSNGDPVTAHDFVYGWTRFCSPELPSPTWASFFPSVVRAMDYKAGTVPADSVGFKALDDHTLEIRLIKPKALLGFLALASALPMHKPSIEAAQTRGEVENWWMPTHFVGNGPYVLKTFVPDGEFELVVNPYYVGPRGNVDRFVLKSMNMLAQSAQIQQYEAGEIDVAHVQTLGDYAYATKAKHLNEHVVLTPEMGYTGIQIARTVNPLMNDDDLRRAIAMALDKGDIAHNIMGGRVTPTSNFGPMEDTLINLGIKTENPDKEAAKRYLARSSYRGEPIYIFTPPSTDIKGLGTVAEAIQSHLKAIGLNVLIENMEEGMLSTYMWGGGYIDDVRYTRPGLTLFPGKVLWKDPIMMLRLADHSWFWMNFDYPLKELRKRLTVERINIKKENKGDKPEDWRELQSLRDSAALWFAQIRKAEPDTVYRSKVLELDYSAQFDRIVATLNDGATREEKISKWQSAKDLLLDAHFNFLTYFQNRANYEGNRIFAHLETMTLEDAEAPRLIREFIQLSLKQNWIIPIYSEKLVYLRRPFIQGESINKFGMWNVLFNLQYIEVDKEAYLSRAGRMGSS